MMLDLSEVPTDELRKELDRRDSLEREARRREAEKARKEGVSVLAEELRKEGLKVLVYGVDCDSKTMFISLGGNEISVMPNHIPGKTFSSELVVDAMKQQVKRAFDGHILLYSTRPKPEGGMRVRWLVVRGTKDMEKAHG